MKKKLYKPEKSVIGIDNKQKYYQKSELKSPAFLLGLKMQKHYLQDMIEPVVEEAGYELVRIMTVGQTNPTLQVMIDTADHSRDITVDDCAEVSRRISDILDEKDPIKDRYSLEVSSPGLDRPLTKPAHFKRFSGYEIKLETENKVENRKRFKGRITAAGEENITVSMDGNEYVIPYAEIAKAKLVLNDELWEKYQAAHEAAEL